MSADIQHIDIDTDTDQSQGLRAASPKRINSALILVIIFTVIFALVMAWQWYDTRNQIAGLQHELAKRLAEADVSGKESRNLSTEATEAGRRTETKVNLLEAKLAESQSQQLALEALYQELTRNRDEATLEEIEQLLLIANQQLQLASNVKAALIAMQEADARLQRIDRPQLSPLRKILAKDMDLLKAAPYVDTAGISLRLDSLAGEADTLPLAMEFRPPEVGPSAGQIPATEESVWLKFARAAWEDVKRLVRIQHMDKPDAALLSPSQAYFLRENLKLRLLSARHALLARDGASFKIDLNAALDWINRYYDNKSESVVNMLEALHQLKDSEVGIEMPRISASLDAVRNYRLARDRGNR
ncbi:MAG: uroporphyrinogen-III C-methyltransferase [Pseudomonadota bacterium]|nr:uroporphyrinogen-III C-methyltransferase [Pseudomonadota bacterium]